jgi:hypothetical protein
MLAQLAARTGGRWLAELTQQASVQLAPNSAARNRCQPQPTNSAPLAANNTTMKHATTLLCCVYLAKKYDRDWKSSIRLQLRCQTLYPHGLWQQGNRAKRRMAALGQ